jgi:hypothetical protein
MAESDGALPRVAIVEPIFKLKERRHMANQTKPTPEDQQARIAAIRERLKGVDPEGWGFYVEDERSGKDCDYRVYRNDGAWGVCKPTHSSQHQRKTDAEFIAAAPSDITFLLDALASAQAAAPSPWQPIATAPKMLKIIVFYRNTLGKGRCVMACYYKERSLEMADDYAEVGEYDEALGNSYAPEGWYEEHDSDSPLMSLQEAPTHWMPLPEVPHV